MSVRKDFERHVLALELITDVKFDGDTVESKLISLRNLTLKNDSLRQQINHYKTYLVTSMFEVMNDGHDFGVKNIMPLVTQRIISALFAGVASKTSESNPKTHHWLPATYLQGFGKKVSSSGSSKKRVRAEVPGVAFFKTGTMQVTVNDLQFAHGRGDDDTGYYDLAVENMFGNLENSYSQFREIDKTSRNAAKVHLTAFAVAQMLRNPNANNSFREGDLSSVIGGMIDLLDSLGEIFVSSLKSNKRLPFTPYVPARLLVESSGRKVLYFPLSANFAILVSTMKIRDNESIALLNKLRDSVIKTAQRHNSIVFGLSRSEL